MVTREDVGLLAPFSERKVREWMQENSRDESNQNPIESRIGTPTLVPLSRAPSLTPVVCPSYTTCTSWRKAQSRKRPYLLVELVMTQTRRPSTRTFQLSVCRHSTHIASYWTFFLRSGDILEVQLPPPATQHYQTQSGTGARLTFSWYLFLTTPCSI